MVIGITIIKFFAYHNITTCKSSFASKSWHGEIPKSDNPGSTFYYVVLKTTDKNHSNKTVLTPENFQIHNNHSSGTIWMPKNFQIKNHSSETVLTPEIVVI